jgi:hypothetical protein
MNFILNHLSNNLSHLPTTNDKQQYRAQVMRIFPTIIGALATTTAGKFVFHASMIQVMARNSLHLRQQLRLLERPLATPTPIRSWLSCLSWFSVSKGKQTSQKFFS